MIPTAEAAMKLLLGVTSVSSYLRVEREGHEIDRLGVYFRDNFGGKARRAGRTAAQVRFTDLLLQGRRQ
jgi:hypothetical protein